MPMIWSMSSLYNLKFHFDGHRLNFGDKMTEQSTKMLIEKILFVCWFVCCFLVDKFKMRINYSCISQMTKNNRITPKPLVIHEMHVACVYVVVWCGVMCYGTPLLYKYAKCWISFSANRNIYMHTTLSKIYIRCKFHAISFVCLFTKFSILFSCF